RRETTTSGQARRPEGREHEGEHEQPGGAGDEVGGHLETSRLAPETGAEPRVGVLRGAGRARLVELATRRPGDRAQRPGIGPQGPSEEAGSATGRGPETAAAREAAGDRSALLRSEGDGVD